MVIFHNMHFCPSKHGIHKISSLSGNYGNNLHIRLTLDFLVIFPDGSHGIGDSHGGQATAPRESIVSDGSHGIGDGNGGQADAITESRASDGSHGIGDGNGGQAAAVIVFVYICVSKPSRQNGRKVTRKYIRIAEKIKI